MPFTLQKIRANNPGPMTFEGTNCYLLQTPQSAVLIDAGPAEDQAHIEAILSALKGRKLDAILLTHGHRDHAGGAQALRQAAGAPLMGFSPSLLPELQLDHAIEEGAQIFGLEAIHTPGHAPDHLCYALPDGTVFTGDHVMGWSSSFIPAGHGNLALYLKSLEKLIARDFKRFFPGHGEAIEAPEGVMRGYIATRLRREEQIFARLTAHPQSLEALAESIYGERAFGGLRPAILQTVFAHLVKLAEDNRAREGLSGWHRPQP